MNTLREVVFVTIVVICPILSAVQAEAGEITLQVGVTGTNNLKGLDNPVTVSKLPEASMRFFVSGI